MQDKALTIVIVCILTQVAVPDAYGNVISRVYRRSLETHSEPEIVREAGVDASSRGIWFNNVSPHSAGLTYMLPFWWHFLRPMLQTIVINSSFKQQLQQEYDNELEKEIQIENNGIGEFKLEGNVGNGQEIEISNEHTEATNPEQIENNFESNGQEEPEAQEHDNAQENMTEALLETNDEQESNIGTGGTENDSGFEGDGFINTIEEDGSSSDLIENSMESLFEVTNENKLKEPESITEETKIELPEVNKESLSDTVFETNGETKLFEVDVKTENEQSLEETKTEVGNNILKVERSEGETSR